MSNPFAQALAAESSLSSGWKVFLQIGDPSAVPETALWDTSNWGEGAWGSNSTTAYLLDVTSRVEALRTETGRRTFTGRFKTGKATVVLDNTDGAFTFETGSTPVGVLRLRPGRSVWIQHNSADVFFGFVDTLVDRYGDDGNLQTVVGALDRMGGWSTNSRVAVPEEGAGEPSDERYYRLLQRFDPEIKLRVWAEPGVPLKTMQGTTMGQDMLALTQLVADSEGGGAWIDTYGFLQVTGRTYFAYKATLPIDYSVGGASPIKARSVKTNRSAQRIVNEAHYSRRGGTEQLAINTESQGLFGRRTHTRLDLENDNDEDVETLAARLVQFGGADRLRITELSFLPEPGTDTEMMAESAKFGDTLLVNVETIQGWSWTQPTQLFGIVHEVTPSAWVATFRVDDTIFEPNYAAFNQEAFNQEAFA